MRSPTKSLAGKYGTTIGYLAAKSEDPSGALIVNEVDVLYQRLYQLAIGIQEAGPDLTPQTFAQGMWNYPGRQRPVWSGELQRRREPLLHAHAPVRVPVV